VLLAGNKWQWQALRLRLVEQSPSTAPILPPGAGAVFSTATYMVIGAMVVFRTEKYEVRIRSVSSKTTEAALLFVLERCNPAIELP
jgi:hypothetical protein